MILNIKVRINQILKLILQVESIQMLREVGGRTEYKVRWKGFGPKYDSWLSEDELNCPDILNRFKAALEKLEKQEDWQVSSCFNYFRKRLY